LRKKKSHRLPKKKKRAINFLNIEKEETLASAQRVRERERRRLVPDATVRWSRPHHQENYDSESSSSLSSRKNVIQDQKIMIQNHHHHQESSSSRIIIIKKMNINQNTCYIYPLRLRYRPW
jgi:hypothetical protein